MPDQTSLLPDRATISPEDWRRIKLRCRYYVLEIESREAAHAFTYQDGWLAGVKAAHEALITMRPPIPPEDGA